MGRSRIVITGASPTLQGLSWQTEDLLRIGTQGNMDIILSDTSVSRVQAEIRASRNGWIMRDLADSENYPSIHNNQPLRGGFVRLSLHDSLQFGRIKVKVSSIHFKDWGYLNCPDDIAQSVPQSPGNIKTSRGRIRIEAAAHRSWDEALQTIVADPSYRERQSEHLLTLLRTGHHLRHITSLDELVRSILRDAVNALDAQRGALVLADERSVLHSRALCAPNMPESVVGRGYSRTLAKRCFSQGESLLCQDVTTEKALRDCGSVRRGDMMSIICAVMRSPRAPIGILHLDRGPFQQPFTPNDLYLADAIAASAAVGIESAQLVERQREEFIEAVTSLARTVEMRDQSTGDHTRRVTDYALLLGRELGLSNDELYRIRIGTPLHDIGKIGIRDEILRKPGPLTEIEFQQMKEHTVKGATILGTMRSLSPMIPIVRHHHERWDGKGYPDGLACAAIPEIARVVCVADAFDAMTSDRPYRAAMPADKAFAEICKHAGAHFAPDCVEAFLRIRPLIEDRLERGLFHERSGDLKLTTDF